MNEEQGFHSWAIVELLGHVRLGAFVTEETLAGAGMLRLEIPVEDSTSTMYVNPASLYRVTPVAEDVARSVAQHNKPDVIKPWEMPRSRHVAFQEPEELEYSDGEEE